MCIMLSDGFNFVSHVRTPSRGIDLWIFLKVETNFEKILRHDDWDMVLTVTSWHWCISQMNYKFVGMLMFFLMCVFQKKIIYIYIYVCLFSKKNKIPIFAVKNHWCLSMFLFKHIPCCFTATFQALKAIRLQWHPDKQLDTWGPRWRPPRAKMVRYGPIVYIRKEPIWRYELWCDVYMQKNVYIYMYVYIL